ncbi:MAG: tyrosine-type recombinase/integrase [Sumerlaeia bacterium]
MEKVSYKAALEGFLSWLRIERNLAPRSRKAYQYDLERFHDWFMDVQSNDTLAAISGSTCEDYLRHLRDDLNCETPTINRYFASLQAFFTYAILQEWLSENPLKLIARSQTPKKLPVYLAEDELRRLFLAPDQTTAKGIRDYAAVVTLAYGGLRVSELVGLNTTDVDFNRDTLRVLGKGRKERLVPMNQDLRQALVQYLEADLRVPAPGEKALFLNAKGKRISVRAVQYIVDELATAAGVEKDVISPHKLRHTFATLLHKNDVDLIDIQALMGHASLASTQIYTHTDTRRLKQTIDLLDF